MLLRPVARLRPMFAVGVRRLGRARRAFRGWRGQRPFWGSLLLALAGLMILIPPYASFRVGDMAIAIGTIGGVSSVLIGGLLVTIGVALWLRPEFRVIGGIAGGLLALVSFVTTNLGGLVIGMLAGLVGAALLLSWTDQPPAERRLAPETAEVEPDAQDSGADAPPEAEIP